MKNKDKAGEEYWEQEWSNFKIPDPKTITGRSPGNYIQYSYHQFFSSIFSTRDVEGKSILELGCGNSAWLPYFSMVWGLNVFGLDYSEEGCKKARFILDKAGVSGEVVHADMFFPPEEFIERFDYVCSFGVVEHFDDTGNAMLAASRFLKTGGILITTVPNHNGLTGLFQKTFSREIFNIHKILDKSSLSKAAREAGLITDNDGYFINFSLYANPGIKGSKNPFYRFKKMLLKLSALFSRACWFKELYMFPSRPSKKYSAAVFNIAYKPES